MQTSGVFIQTNDGAPRYKLYAVDYANPDRASWKEVIPEKEDVLQDLAIMKDEIVAGPYVVSLDSSSLLTGTFDGKVTDVSNTLLKPEQAIPLQPDPIIATGGNNSVLLTWDRVDHLGHPADGYVVYKAKPGETTFAKVKELAGDQTSFLDETVNATLLNSGGVVPERTWGV